jgi:hypothetical protein
MKPAPRQYTLSRNFEIRQCALNGRSKRTLKRTETTVHDQFKIAQLALSEHDGGKSGGLGLELVVAGSIASDEVLEDTTVRSVSHIE